MEKSSIEEIEIYLRENRAKKFDLVCCFSVTMWIHINFGDLGLQEFLHKSAELTRGFLLIEPQTRKCYCTARQRLRKRRLPFPPYLEELFGKQDLSPDLLIIEILTEIGVHKYSVLGKEDWGRSLISFSKVEGDCGSQHRLSTPSMQELLADDAASVVQSQVREKCVSKV
jgi:Bicoid-interacting protein 3 (Bin3)